MTTEVCRSALMDDVEELQSNGDASHGDIEALKGDGEVFVQMFLCPHHFFLITGQNLFLLKYIFSKYEIMSALPELITLKR